MDVAEFAELVRGDPHAVELDQCAAAIARALRGDVDRLDVLCRLDELAAACPSPTPEGVARYLFAADGFHGNHAAYYDWRNSCIDQVLEHRRGIPITLSVLMIEVGRRVGVSLHGVGMPAHFLVGVAGQERYFDPFHGGVELDETGVRSLFERVSDGKVRWHPAFLRPTPNRHVVIRMLNNLRSIFVARRDEVRLAIVMQLRSVIPEIAEAEATAIDEAVAPFN